jgi:hypothetical protein
MFFIAQNQAFSNHDSPHDHHEFTSQKPRAAPHFLQNPLQKCHKLQKFAPPPLPKKIPEKNGVG